MSNHRQKVSQQRHIHLPLTFDAHYYDAAICVASKISRHPRDVDVIKHWCTKINGLSKDQRSDSGVVSNIWCKDDITIVLVDDVVVFVDPERQASPAVEVPDRWRSVGLVTACVRSFQHVLWVFCRNIFYI